MNDQNWFVLRTFSRITPTAVKLSLLPPKLSGPASRSLVNRTVGRPFTELVRTAGATPPDGTVRVPPRVERFVHDDTTPPELVTVEPVEASSHHSGAMSSSDGVQAIPAVAFTGNEAGPVPTALVAVTLTEYAVPGVRPVIVHVGRGSNMNPEMTALLAPVWSALTVTVPPAATVTGTSIHWPALNDAGTLTTRLLVPAVIVIVCERVVASQSTT